MCSRGIPYLLPVFHRLNPPPNACVSWRTSSYLRDTAGFFADPLHGHSFQAVQPAALSAVDRSLLFFRDCALCGDRMLSILTRAPSSGTRRRRTSGQPSRTGADPGESGGYDDANKPPRSRRATTTTGTVCQCLGCGAFVHRDCLSYAHRHRHCRGHKSLLSACKQRADASRRVTQLITPAKSEGNPVAIRRQQQQLYARLFGDSAAIQPDPATTSLMTLSDLIEELSITAGSASTSSRDATTRSTSSNSNAKQRIVSFSRESGPFNHRETAKAAMRMAKRVSPVLAAGGVIGALALGPAGGVIAGINMLLGGMGFEALVAGVGLTAATAAAATVTHQQKLRKASRHDEELRSGEWATRVCWDCKRSHGGVPSDDAFRKDAELLRRFQIPQRVPAPNDPSSLKNDPHHLAYPSDDELYAFLFGILASPSEFLGQINLQLCESFRQRHFARQKHSSGRSLTSSSGSQVCKETLHDAKMYVAHMVGATVQSFPSLASTPDAMASCTLAIERIIFDDIYAIVFGEFQRAFGDANTVFYDTIEAIRREQQQQPTDNPSPSIGDEVAKAKAKRTGRLVLSGDLLDAEAKLMTMMHSARSPLQKLDLLCEAFRAICCFADKLHQTASNADILIPLVCAVLIESTRFFDPASSDGGGKRAFVSEIAFTSFFTSGGGKGVEGYVLTSFQAAIQVIAAVDVTKGSAKELELFVSDDEEEGEDDDEEEEEFFDAVAAR